MGQDSLNNYVDTPTAGGIHTASGAIFVLDGATNSLFSQMFARIYAQYAWDGPSRTYKFKSGLIDHRWDQPFTGYANRPQVRGALYSASLSCKSEGLCQEDTSESITVNGSTSTVTGQNGLYLATITYYAFADKDHMPLTGMQFDPGNGTGILMTGKPFPTPVLFKNQRGTNSSNVNICGSSADWGLTTDSCSPRYFVQSVTYSCSPDDLGILPSCAASPKKYPCQQGGACRFKPRVWFIDNWEICTGTCNGTFCRGSDCTFLSEGDDRNRTGASDKKPWIDFPGEIVVTP
jgi:hypothetical protein